MKKLFIILYLLTNIFVLGACGDVESEGDPQPRVPRVEVESDDYYVQITQENMDGVAFVYRWLDIETASKYVMTLGLQQWVWKIKAYLLITEYANSFLPINR